jgi:hypothetical protein
MQLDFFSGTGIKNEYDEGRCIGSLRCSGGSDMRITGVHEFKGRLGTIMSPCHKKKEEK